MMALRDVITALDPIEASDPKSLRKLSSRLRWETGWQGNGPLSYRALQRTVGGNSLEETLHAVDRNNPPQDLSQAYERLGLSVEGLVTQLPDGPISLRKIAQRLKGPDTVALRLLSYNTYLLPGFQIPFGRWLDDTVGWDALSWFGIPFGGALLVTLGVASIPGVALATILKLAGFTPSKVIQRILGIDLNRITHIKAKPARDERATEIGIVLAAYDVCSYDVCCLSEVFTNDSRERIMAGLGGAQWTATTGPDESGAWMLLSSGLFFLVKNRRITRTEQMIFANRGERQRDSDAWSNKGVLLNVIDVGVGQLELFQTHLCYGGGIPLLPEPSEDDRMGVCCAELAQLAEFYRQHHTPQNVAIITGDFNMSGANLRHYALMRRTMDSLNLHDLWSWDVYGHDPSWGLTCRFTDGDDSKWIRDFNAQCDYKPSLEDAQYCDDYTPMDPPPSGVGRMDYIFAERPTEAHRYNLEVSRILRRPFPFKHKTEKELYLSDHLGLDMMMYISPR